LPEATAEECRYGYVPGQGGGAQQFPVFLRRYAH